MTRAIRRAIIALAALAALGAGGACGGSTKGTARIGAGGVVKKRDPVNPKAAKAFESAMRALRLGGPDAHDTAKARLKEALDIDPKLWEAHYDLGIIAFRDGEDDLAIDHLSKALLINKNHTPSLLARAEAHRRAGHRRDARADYEAAVRTAEEDDPNRREASARLASMLRDAGEYDDAVTILRETVRIHGVNARIYTELGLIYIQQKRPELAQLVLAKALELDAKDPAIYNALAMLALRSGKAQEAFQLFDQAVSLDATYIDARFNKATVLLDAGDYQRAKVELSAIVERRPDDYAAHVALGVAQRGLKEHEAAKKTWDRVIREAPRRSTARADAMFNLALLKLDFLEDPAGGKVELERYLQEAPISHAKRQAAEEKRKDLGK
ncbi:MAG TPA: tetratricopeptide repeat protein [Kofleriaceae bacterium]|nr:tetratricopeptide repeat protein [Kofleriaceae bacterium]